jgi:hypothetical protein
VPFFLGFLFWSFWKRGEGGASRFFCCLLLRVGGSLECESFGEDGDVSHDRVTVGASECHTTGTSGETTLVMFLVADCGGEEDGCYLLVLLESTRDAGGDESFWGRRRRRYTPFFFFFFVFFSFLLARGRDSCYSSRFESQAQAGRCHTTGTNGVEIRLRYALTPCSGLCFWEWRRVREARTGGR